MLLWIVAFPAMWPLHLLRCAWRERAHEQRTKRIDPKAEAELLRRVRDGEAKHALVSTLGWTSMASGPEEEVCIELRFSEENAPESTAVAAWTRALEDLLTEKRVPRSEVETYRLGLSAIFGWGLWIAEVFAIIGAVSGATVWLMFAAMTLLALLAFARS